MTGEQKQVIVRAAILRYKYGNETEELWNDLLEELYPGPNEKPGRVIISAISSWNNLKDGELDELETEEFLNRFLEKNDRFIEFLVDTIEAEERRLIESLDLLLNVDDRLLD